MTIHPLRGYPTSGATVPLSTTLEECLKQSVEAVMTMICGGETQYLGCPHDGMPCEGIFGMISLAGPTVCSLVLELPRPTAIGLALAFAGYAIDFESTDMGDVVGELANILAGDFVARLSEVRITATLSIPVVARGQEVEILLPSELPSLRLAFMVPAGIFWIKVATVPRSR
jgi:chemotaxis protein CheX